MLLVVDLQQVCFVLPHSGERHAAAACFVSLLVFLCPLLPLLFVHVVLSLQHLK